MVPSLYSEENEEGRHGLRKTRTAGGCALRLSAEAGASLEPGKGETGGRAGSPHTPSFPVSGRSPRDVAVPSVTATPTPGRRCCPHRFPPSRLFSSVKGVSGSQASHNFSPGLHLLTRGASPPTPPRPAAAPPVSPAPTRKPPESTFRDGAAGNTPRSPRASEPVDFGWIGGGGHRRSDRRREILLPNGLPSTPPKTRAVPGANF